MECRSWSHVLSGRVFSSHACKATRLRRRAATVRGAHAESAHPEDRSARLRVLPKTYLNSPAVSECYRYRTHLHGVPTGISRYPHHRCANLGQGSLASQRPKLRLHMRFAWLIRLRGPATGPVYTFMRVESRDKMAPCRRTCWRRAGGNGNSGGDAASPTARAAT